MITSGLAVKPMGETHPGPFNHQSFLNTLELEQQPPVSPDPNICSLGYLMLTGSPHGTSIQHPCSCLGENLTSLTRRESTDPSPRAKAGRPYLAGRVCRAPWAAAPSCCLLGHPGPSWQWVPGPGNAGFHPVLSCSGTWLPAGASWRLCKRTETSK